jgi:hypothetical protein
VSDEGVQEGILKVGGRVSATEETCKRRPLCALSFSVVLHGTVGLSVDYVHKVATFCLSRPLCCRGNGKRSEDLPSSSPMNLRVRESERLRVSVCVCMCVCVCVGACIFVLMYVCVCQIPQEEREREREREKRERERESDSTSQRFTQTTTITTTLIHHHLLTRLELGLPTVFFQGFQCMPSSKSLFCELSNPLSLHFSSFLKPT